MDTLVDMNGLYQRPTVSGKMALVNRKFGNTNISSQQSTSRQLYHALPLDGRTSFQFFRNVGAGTGLTGEVGLPWNNIPENKLQVEESLVWRRMVFQAIEVDAQSGAVTDVTDLTTAGVPEIYAGDYSIFFDTMCVMKPNPLSQQLPLFSKNSNHTLNEWIWFDNDGVSIPKVQFMVQLDVPTYTPASNARIRLVVEGFGSLMAPRNQF